MEKHPPIEEEEAEEEVEGMDMDTGEVEEEDMGIEAGEEEEEDTTIETERGRTRRRINNLGMQEVRRTHSGRFDMF